MNCSNERAEQKPITSDETELMMSAIGSLVASSIASMPDLSGLAQLKVWNLPKQLEPWEKGWRKAYSITDRVRAGPDAVAM